MDELADHAPILRVVFARPVSVEQAHSHGLRAEPCFRVLDLQLIYPFGDSIVVHLLDGIIYDDILGHQITPVSVNLRAAAKYHSEIALLLKMQDILSSNVQTRLPDDKQTQAGLRPLHVVPGGSSRCHTSRSGISKRVASRRPRHHARVFAALL